MTLTFSHYFLLQEFTVDGRRLIAINGTKLTLGAMKEDYRVVLAVDPLYGSNLICKVIALLPKRLKCKPQDNFEIPKSKLALPVMIEVRLYYCQHWDY